MKFCNTCRLAWSVIPWFGIDCCIQNITCFRHKKSMSLFCKIMSANTVYYSWNLIFLTSLNYVSIIYRILILISWIPLNIHWKEMYESTLSNLYIHVAMIIDFFVKYTGSQPKQSDMYSEIPLVQVAWDQMMSITIILPISLK